ncbi:F-box protein At2g26160-like [Cornus florida]|uniref:F-box protein At2g26160-like n=1 Tax=Cornus florida TaxID=4283 RepID=UPI0028A20DFA|nr:F-box protein At2g26160-like [Cornus florida]
MAFYRLRNKKWSPFFTNSTNRFEEAVFYKGHFYAVDDIGVLRRLLFDIDSNSYEEEVVSVDIGGNTSYRYLVESSSSCGGVTMMVVRRFDFERGKTELFEIFKLDWSNGNWEEVSNLGDQALFLAHCDSKLVSVSLDNPEYRQNTIYFIDDVFAEDFGMYNLGNRYFEPLKIPSSHMRHPFCGWIQPAA